MLRTPCAPCRTIEEGEQVVNILLATLQKSSNGVGLAANQIGVPYRICVIGIPEEEEIRVLINPEIIVAKGERELDEGSLSVPGYQGRVKRSEEVRVRAKDRDGNSIRIKAENNLLAQALEHEIDHLNGILFVDRVTSKYDLNKELIKEGFNEKDVISIN